MGTNAPRRGTIGWSAAAAACLLAACGGGAATTSSGPRTASPSPLARFDGAEGHPGVNLAPASSVPLPRQADAAAAPPLRAHEMFGFAPYWTLDTEASYPLDDLSTVAYFGVDVGGDGSLARSGSGWDGFRSQALVDLIDRAHAAGDSVVLTAKCFDQPTLDLMLRTPGAAAHLADELVAAVRDRRMDGVNLDLEGSGGAGRDLLTAFVTTVSQRLHAADPHWQVTVDTYPSSAADSTAWFDVPRLAAAVDALFVMAYGMQDDAHPSPVAPLQGGGRSDLSVVDDYLRAVPPDRVLLGVPFYGLDWPTDGPQRGATATGPPTVLGVAQLVGAGHPRYWDLEAFTPWTSYQDGTGAWHQAHWDDADSLGYKARLANAGHLRGLGIWALGMDGNNRAMVRALLGNSRPVKEQLGPQSSPTPSPPTPSPTPGRAPTNPPAGTARPSPSPSPRPSAQPSASPSPTPLVSPPPLP